jgi:hypothetical protein
LHLGRAGILTGCSSCDTEPTLSCFVECVRRKELYVGGHQTKLISLSCWQYKIFNWIVKLVKNVCPTLYLTRRR